MVGGETIQATTSAKTISHKKSTAQLVIEELGDRLAGFLIHYIPGLSTVGYEKRRSLGFWSSIGITSALLIVIVGVLVGAFVATQEPIIDWISFGFKIGIGSSLTVNEGWERLGAILIQLAGFFFGVSVLQLILTLKDIYESQGDAPRTQDVIISDEKREAIKRDLRDQYESDHLRKALQGWANNEGITTTTDLKTNLRGLTSRLKTLMEDEIIDKQAITHFRIHNNKLVSKQVNRLYRENSSNDSEKRWNRARRSILCDLGIIILEERVIENHDDDT